MANEDLAQNAVSVFLESGLVGLCGGAAEPPASANDIAAALPYKGNWVCEAPLKTIREGGLDVVMVDMQPKCVILLNLDQLGADWHKRPQELIAWPGWDQVRALFAEPKRA